MTVQLAVKSERTLRISHEPSAWERIHSFKNPRVIDRYITKHHVTREEAETLFLELLRFFYLCRQGRKAGFLCSPSPLIDEAWHNFILFTREYETFCKEYIGWFIHHKVSDGTEASIYAKTREIAESIFGTLDNRAWPNESSAQCQVACAPGDPCTPDPDPD